MSEERRAQRETEASHYRGAGGYALVITPLAPLMLRGDEGAGARNDRMGRRLAMTRALADLPSM